MTTTTAAAKPDDKATAKKATAKKGRRGDAVKAKSSKKKVKKKIDKQKELFEKRSPKHKQICELAREAFDSKEQADEWGADAEASRMKLTALLRKEGIKGVYNADGIKIKPKTTQEKHTCELKQIEEPAEK